MKYRAAVDPITLVVVAVVGIALALAAPSSSTPGRKHFWQFWKKNPIEQVNLAKDAVDQAKRAAEASTAAAKAKVDQEREKQLEVGHDAAIATGAAISAAQAATAAGKLPAKELQTAKILNATNVQAMDQALGASAPSRVRELEQMVADLNAGIAAGSKSLEILQGTLDASVKDKAKALADLESVKAANKSLVDAAERTRDMVEKKEQAWALERDGLARQYEQLRFWGSLGVALMVLVIGYIWLRGASAARLNHDLVAGSEWLRSKLPADIAPAVEQEWNRDWVTPHDGTAAAVAKIKAKLRL
jgi:hypothetical protein